MGMDFVALLKYGGPDDAVLRNEVLPPSIFEEALLYGFRRQGLKPRNQALDCPFHALRSLWSCLHKRYGCTVTTQRWPSLPNQEKSHIDYNCIHQQNKPPRTSLCRKIGAAQFMTLTPSTCYRPNPALSKETFSGLATTLSFDLWGT